MRVFVFPGQGSQRPGMGLPWVADPAWRLVAEGSEVLGTDLAWLLTEAPAEVLKGPFEAQVSTYLMSMLVLTALRRTQSEAPAAVAGHSLGELSALAAAGAYTALDGLTVVGARGRAMAAAARQRPGVMSAVLGASDEAVEQACAQTPDAWPANYNAPQHIVVSGSAEAVPLAAERSGARRVMALPVGGAYHTPFMQPAREALAEALASRPPGRAALPVWCNLDAAPHTDGFTDLLLAQLTSPVRWVQTVQALAAQGMTQMLELGPGGVLTGLARRAAPEVAARSVATPEDLA